MTDESDAELQGAPHSQHFLVVDDDDQSRATVVEYLKSLGYKRVTQAKDGADALRKLDKEPSINFIISDWDMPLMDGFTFLQRIKFTPGRANLPFLIITSPISQEAEKVVLAAENMVDGYLIKPFRAQLLKEKIDSALSVAIRGPQKQVVLVDDDSDARDMVAEYLQKMGFKDIQTFDNGLKAKAYLDKNADKVGMIISDWEMPEITGVQLLSFAKSTPSLKDIPFLIVTSQSSIERMKVMQAAKERVDDYLLKPFSADEIRRRIEGLIERSRSSSGTQELIDRATDHLEHGRFQQAHDQFEEVLRIDPDNEIALRGIGDALAKTKGVQAALPFYKRAVEVGPVNPKGYLRLSAAYDQVGWIDKAIALLQTANQQISFNSDLHFRLGQLFMRKDDEVRALVEFEKTLAIQLDHQEARLMIEMLSSRNRK